MGNAFGGDHQQGERSRHESRTSFFLQGYRNGQYLMRLPHPQHGFGFTALPHRPPAEHLKAKIIQNHVNLKKSSLTLEEDEGNPGEYLLAFSYDATLCGSACILFLAKEGLNCSLVPLKPSLFRPQRIPFVKGIGQMFRQVPGTGVKLSLFGEQELQRDGKNDVYTLVIRMEAIPEPTTVPPSTSDPYEACPTAPLPKWMHAQTTHAIIEKREDGRFHVRVVKQRIWVDGARYELQEIFDMGNAGDQYGLTGRECVICLSEPRDTALLPCRHMCMCSGCAKVLRLQSNKCPICRTAVQKLLEITVPKPPEEQQLRLNL